MFKFNKINLFIVNYTDFNDDNKRRNTGIASQH